MSELKREHKRLVAESTEQSDAIRRSWIFTLQVEISFIAMVMAMLIPKSEHLFGDVSLAEAALYVFPSMVLALLSSILYRWLGARSSIYFWSESIESFFHHGLVMAFIYGGKTVFSPFWVLGPFTAFFWAEMKPFEFKRYSIILFLPHAVLAIVWCVEARYMEAAVAIITGAGFVAILLVKAHGGREIVLMRAKRNVAQNKLNNALLDLERKNIESDLRDGLGQEIQSLVHDLEGQPKMIEKNAIILDQARQALKELMSASQVEDPVARSLVDLARLLDKKCRPLCASFGIAHHLLPEAQHQLINSYCSNAMLRVGQELVRNSVTHGQAKSVQINITLGTSLSLTVKDNGVGLPDNALIQATGGLRNAVDGLAELGGKLIHQQQTSQGTKLLATIPLEPHR